MGPLLLVGQFGDLSTIKHSAVIVRELIGLRREVSCQRCVTLNILRWSQISALDDLAELTVKEGKERSTVRLTFGQIGFEVEEQTRPDHERQASFRRAEMRFVQEA